MCQVSVGTYSSSERAKVQTGLVMISFVVADDRVRYNTCADERRLLCISGTWGERVSEMGSKSYIYRILKDLLKKWRENSIVDEAFHHHGCTARFIRRYANNKARDEQWKCVESFRKISIAKQTFLCLSVTQG